MVYRGHLWGWVEALGVGGSSEGRSQVGDSCSRAVPACQLSVRRNWLHDWVWGCLMLVYQQHLLIFFLPWWQLRLFGSPHSRSASLTVSSCPPWHENYVWIIQKRYAAKTAQSCYNCLRRLYDVKFSVTVLYCIHPAIFFFFCIAFYRIFTGENGGSRGSNKQRLRIRVSVHLHSSILSAWFIRGEIHYIENVVRQHGRNSVGILQVMGYNSGKMQVLKFSRNFQIREMWIVEEEVCRWVRSTGLWSSLCRFTSR